jgi:hypothetical protein
MKPLNHTELLLVEAGGNDTITGICAGLAIGLAGAWALSLTIPGSQGFWLGVGAVCAVNSLV